MASPVMLDSTRSIKLVSGSAVGRAAKPQSPPAVKLYIHPFQFTTQIKSSPFGARRVPNCTGSRRLTSSCTVIMSSEDYPASSSVTHSARQGADSPPDLRLLHYNDVYHLQESSSHPCGGVSRFQTVCNYYRNDPSFKGQPKLLTFFSGDAYNPSLESSVTKGRHMVPILNAIGTDVACVGVRIIQSPPCVHAGLAEC